MKEFQRTAYTILSLAPWALLTLGVLTVAARKREWAWAFLFSGFIAFGMLLLVTLAKSFGK